jgi:hypothetical protein
MYAMQIETHTKMPFGAGAARMASRGRAAPREDTVESWKLVRHKEFADRLTMAFDGHPHAPALHHGRLRWIQDQFKDRFKVQISPESARRWFGGIAKPKPDKMTMLARILEVDEAWLAIGTAPDMEPHERRARNAVASGVVNIVAGLISASGGHPAFPTPEQAARADQGVDLFAVIRGGQYTFHVSLAQPEGEGRYVFRIPRDFAQMTIVGAVQKGPLNFTFLLFDTESLTKFAERKGGYYEVTVSEKDRQFATRNHRWSQIVDFGGPLTTK